MEIYAVKINGFEKPIGYLFDTLLCSWKVRGAKGNKQANAHIAVSTDPALDTVLYEVSKAELDALGVPLGLRLAPCTRYYYRVTVTSDLGEIAQSNIEWFETGKLDQPWEAQWLGFEDDTRHPEFAKTFRLDRDVAQARLYICGLGLFEADINGKKAGNDFLAPFINDYEEHVQYCTYDVTDLLSADNELRVRLGKGWWMGRFGLAGRQNPERGFALIAELRVWYKDGGEAVIGTDASWSCRGSVFELSDIYDGEIQNHLLWEGRENPWQPANITSAPAALTARYSPPLHAMEALGVKEVINTPAGETVLDFGQNLAGYVECSQQLPKGTVLTMEFGEILQNGNFYHDNYRTAKSVFRTISDGKTRLVRPYFTFFGFRYVKISGLEQVDESAFIARAVYSGMERVGTLETGNAKINRLHENTLWGLKSNFLDMPTDCPQRDERLGWTGDAQVFCRTAGYLMDTRGFYAKFLRDLRSDQLRCQGKVAIYLPNNVPGATSAVWSDIAALLPDMFYDYYGSRDMLSLHYPLMKDWVDSVRREDIARGEKHLWDFGFHFGDWLALDGATEQSTFGRTDDGFIASAYFYASASCVAKAAALLGKGEAEEYARLAEDIRAAILNEYFTKTGRLAIDTQTGYLVALKFNLYTDKARIIEGLRARFKKDCGRIKGGFVGATMMNTVLAENGLSDIAYDLLFFEGFPGWLYAINLGATTIWERWNSVLPDGSISGTGMNSLNHYSYGSVVEFLYRHSAGIAPLTPGFRKARIAPLPEIRLGHLTCAYDSAAGLYVSSWNILEDGSVSFHIEIPFGCEAELVLPEQKPLTLTAGSYDYNIKTLRDYRKLYNADTPMERLLENESAVAVLEKHLPDALKALNRSDVEAMSKSLSDLSRRALLFRASSDRCDMAIEEIQRIRI